MKVKTSRGEQLSALGKEAAHQLSDIWFVFKSRARQFRPAVALDIDFLRLGKAGGSCLKPSVGLFSRPIAFLLSGSMAFAYFIAHYPNGFFPVLNHGEAAMLYCFLFLYISAAGPGVWSVDAFQERKVAANSAGLQKVA